MQDLDTYGCIRRYARDPYDISNILAFRLLRRRAEVSGLWGFVQHNAGLNVEKAMKLSVGALLDDSVDFGGPVSGDAFIDRFMSMSEEERLAFYKEACRQARAAEDAAAEKQN